ncbi:ogr/Delta-like zinc finger family protein [Serratia fonticola]|uniref:ogr/Delta-like zinc finger family protein n=1 Tax=Serratia fonticola TaxID=47917 RepID=UPI000E0FD6C6
MLCHLPDKRDCLSGYPRTGNTARTTLTRREVTPPRIKKAISMFICPACKRKINTTSTRTLTENTKEKYYYCNNKGCLMAFKTLEGLETFIRIPDRKAS